MEDYEPMVFDMYYQIKRQVELMNFNLMDQLTPFQFLCFVKRNTSYPQPIPYYHQESDIESDEVEEEEEEEGNDEEDHVDPFV